MSAFATLWSGGICLRRWRAADRDAAINSDARQVFFEGLDLCSITTVTLKYDRDTKRTTALVQ
jgi:hypothetical protein